MATGAPYPRTIFHNALNDKSKQKGHRMKISPSTLDYYAACPCFQFRPFEVKGSAAEEGTKMHKAFEDDDDSELTEEQRRRVQQTRQLVEAQKTSFLDWKDDDPINYRTHHEERMRMSLGLTGKMDKAFVNLKLRRALVFDSKYGRLGLIADAKDSLQMASYFDLIMFRYPGLVDEVRCILNAPRTYEVSSHDYLSGDWPQVKTNIQSVIDRVEDPFKLPCLNDVICAKCAHLDRCPAVKKDAIVPAAETRLAMSMHTLLKPVEALDVTELAQNRAMLDLLASWIDVRKPAIDARVFGEALDLPGYTKVSKEGSPFIPAEKTGRAWELLQNQITQEQFIGACGKPSIGKLIEAIAADVPATSAAEAKELARQRLFDLVEEVVEKSKPSVYLRRKAKLDLKLIGG